MKIFIIPNPFDYHKEGAVLVKAVNKKEAIEKVTKKFRYNQDGFKPNFSKIKEWTTDIYVNHGCDC